MLLWRLRESVYYFYQHTPELNPCELVFNFVKAHIRVVRTYDSSVFEQVLIALGKVTLPTMKKFYEHCINVPVILPELMNL